MRYRTAGLSLLTVILFTILAAACSGGSTTAPAATIAPTATTAPATGAVPALTAIPGATAVVPPATAPEPPTTVASPVPSATPVPAAPTTLAAAEGFIIEGDAEFVAWTEQALDLLRTKAPEWYDQVEASIRTLRSVSSGSGMDVFNKVYLVGDITANAPGYPPEQQLVWYAGTIVHDSCHSERYDEGLVYQGKEGEVACLIDQKAALLLIDTGTHFGNYVQSLIDGADDPANAYWTNPNRHW